MENLNKPAKALENLKYKQRVENSSVLSDTQNNEYGATRNYPLNPILLNLQTTDFEENERLRLKSLEGLSEMVKKIKPVKNEVGKELCKRHEEIFRRIKEIDEEIRRDNQETERDIEDMNRDLLEIRQKTSECDTKISEMLTNKESLEKTYLNELKYKKMLQYLTLIDVKKVYDDGSQRIVAGTDEKYIEFILGNENENEYFYRFLSTNIKDLDEGSFWKSSSIFEKINFKEFYLTLTKSLIS